MNQKYNVSGVFWSKSCEYKRISKIVPDARTSGISKVESCLSETVQAIEASNKPMHKVSTFTFTIDENVFWDVISSSEQEL